MREMRVAPLAGKRIGLLAGWASRRNGGVFEAMVAQCQLIRELGGEPWVFAARDEWSDRDRERLGGAQACYVDAVGPERLAYAPELAGGLAMARLDCLHLHGIWQGSSLTGSRWARANGGRYLISPHGMLDPWITARGPLRKTLFRKVIERANWKEAQLFHALTLAEAADIERWVPHVPVTVVPNPAPPPGEPRKVMPGPDLVYIGRVHEKKNLRALVEAWRAVLPRLPQDARLTIAGAGTETDVAELQLQVDEAGSSVRFVGPTYGQAKRDLLASARFLILPSLSEGLPMALLDAWAAGTPTIHSAACHLPEGLERGAAIECGTLASSISDALAAALRIDEPRWLSMSRAARQLAAGPFGRATVARGWATIYSGVIGNRRDD